MKRIILALLAVVTMVCLLCGCAHVGVCEECGQREKLNQFVDEDGDIYWYCDDCYRIAKLLSF